METQGLGVVVTGAGHGMGEALAAKLAAEGANVVVNDVEPDAAYRVAKAVGGYAVPGDAASEEGVRALVDKAGLLVGAIDIYFANAGVAIGSGLSTTAEDWEKAVNVNLMAHVRAADVLIPRWLEAGKGRLVVTASAAGLLTMLGDVSYSVTKHAAVAFAEWLSATYGERGIVVQAICPQGVSTGMLERMGPSGDFVRRETVLEASQVADAVWAGLQSDHFLILPHAEVQAYYERRAVHTDEWLASMRRRQRQLDQIC